MSQKFKVADFCYGQGYLGLLENDTVHHAGLLAGHLSPKKLGIRYPLESAMVVARVFFERWIAEGSRQPKCILSDQGGEFDNRLMQELKTLMGIDHVFTKGYNPRENGLTEEIQSNAHSDAEGKGLCT
ncbi:hypothetical protein COOONC_03806, partial [Cooperia oncophora]